MLEPPRADVEQRQDEQCQTAATVVPTRGRTRDVQPTRHVVLPQVTAQQLQPAIRGQLLVPELDVQLPLDHSSQARYAQTHQAGLLCGGSDMEMSAPLKNTPEVVLFHRMCDPFTPQLLSDWV